jgi:hypothetical protein
VPGARAWARIAGHKKIPATMTVAGSVGQM